MKQCHHGYYVREGGGTCPHGCEIPIPCPSCAALRAKLDRDKLAKVVLGATHPTDEKPYTSYEEVADAIIAYMEGK